MDELPGAQERASVSCEVSGVSLKPRTSHLTPALHLPTPAIDRQTKMT